MTVQVRANSRALTPRERDVLVLVAEGLDYKDIADRLYIGYASVVTHMTGVMRKLGARNRTHAVMIALRAGLICLEDIP